jgi:hypothetical protein
MVITKGGMWFLNSTNDYTGTHEKKERDDTMYVAKESGIKICCKGMNSDLGKDYI